MMKIDVAVNSYKKPESLIYTLMTLKKVAGDIIDTVYINDDCSGDGTSSLYRHPDIADYFKPWKLDVRDNTENVGIKQVYVKGYYPEYMNWKFMLKRWGRFFSKEYPHKKEDIRYQYAIDNTDKRYLLLIHDDVLFKKNIVNVYLQAFINNPELAIVGDFGQCWRCLFADVCSPQKILSGTLPSPYWPLTPSEKNSDVTKFNPRKGFTRACRINEWCMMLDVNRAKEITEKSRSFIGNMYPHSDTGAYWFGMAVNLGYKFTDPFPIGVTINGETRKDYYQHQWQGHSGHSVWVDQGQGKAIYDRQMIVDLIAKEFNFQLPEIGNM